MMHPNQEQESNNLSLFGEKKEQPTKLPIVIIKNINGKLDLLISKIQQ